MFIHSIAPVYDSNSKILILGSFPSVKSREEGFFYGHKQNRFWRIIAEICHCSKPQTISEKKKLLLDNRIALWDVIKSCDIIGSGDSTITNVTVNDISKILDHSEIKSIFTNGKKADNLYAKHIEPVTGIKACCLPSTSPANAAWTVEKLYQFWNDRIADKIG